MDLKQPQQTTHPPADGRQHPMGTKSQIQEEHSSEPDNRQQRHQNHSPVPSQSQFRMDDRVVVYNKKGQGIYGSVRWTGSMHYGGKALPAVGIETVYA